MDRKLIIYTNNQRIVQAGNTSMGPHGVSIAQEIDLSGLSDDDFAKVFANPSVYDVDNNVVK